MTAGITEILSDGSPCKGSVILQCSRVARRSSHHNGIVHRTVLVQGIHNRSYGRTFLANGYINAIYRITCFKIGTLVDDGIDGNGCLTGLAVTDNQLTLSATNRYHGVHSLQTGLKRLIHRLAEDDSRCLTFQRHFIKFSAYQSFAIKRRTQRVYYTAQHTLSHHDGSNTLGTLYNEAFLDFIRRAKQHSTHIILFEVHHNGLDAVVELQQLVGFGIAQPIDTGYTVTDLQYRANLVQLYASVNPFQLLAENIGDFAYFYIFRQHLSIYYFTIYYLLFERTRIIYRFDLYNLRITRLLNSKL